MQEFQRFQRQRMSKGREGCHVRNQTFQGTFMFRHFSGRGGGLPNSKVFEELFCLILDIYQERGGVT